MAGTTQENQTVQEQGRPRTGLGSGHRKDKGRPQRELRSGSKETKQSCQGRAESRIQMMSGPITGLGKRGVGRLLSTASIVLSQASDPGKYGDSILIAHPLKAVKRTAFLWHTSQTKFPYKLLGSVRHILSRVLRRSHSSGSRGF